MLSVKPRLLLTAGEPGGIGPDICLALAHEQPLAAIAIVADPAVLSDRARQLGLATPDWPVGSWERPFGDEHAPGIALLPIEFPAPVVAGNTDPRNVACLLDGLARAANLVLAGEADALVTAPVQKSVIIEAGVAFSGHTEFLAELAGAPQPVMLLVAGALRVALATTHLPLRQVPDAITTDRLTRTLTILHADLISRYGLANPRIAVCGLNPHAGERRPPWR